MFKKLLALLLILPAFCFAESYTGIEIVGTEECFPVVSDINNSGTVVGLCRAESSAFDGRRLFYKEREAELQVFDLGSEHGLVLGADEGVGAGGSFVLRIDDAGVIRAITGRSSSEYWVYTFDTVSSESGFTEIVLPAELGTEIDNTVAFFDIAKDGSVLLSYPDSENFRKRPALVLSSDGYKRLAIKSVRFNSDPFFLADGRVYFKGQAGTSNQDGGKVCSELSCTKVKTIRFYGYVEAGNEAGDLAGTMSAADKYYSATAWFPFGKTFVNKVLRLPRSDTFKTPRGTSRSRSFDINNRGDIVGSSVFRSIIAWEKLSPSGGAPDWRPRKIDKYVARALSVSKRSMIASSIQINDCGEIVVSVSVYGKGGVQQSQNVVFLSPETLSCQ